ncbi:MAG: hypothetical protein DRH12_12425 [Deltaproteobacteria bacterium]|nr:MAG: hypothetical protein DRH12_12425 [Deltaproteobacteria bacterium]
MESDLKLTQEQQDVISRDLYGDEVLKIIAFAGTGKTWTLLQYAKARPGVRFLYLAFNRSVREEAEVKFPGNVTCKTAHGLAYRYTGLPYKHKLVNNLRLNTLRRILDMKSYGETKIVLEILKSYLCSADAEPGPQHIPWQARGDKARRDYYLDKVVELWDMMRNPEIIEPGMTHEGYLKLFQLSKPRLDYDCILLDEAQDTNPVTADIVLSQVCPKILVGDPHQQIYTFRGAVDAMELIRGTETLYLTHSFRFGEEIAWLANKILKTFKQEKKKLVGAWKGGNGNGHGFGVIARTNATLFDEAVSLSSGSCRIAFLGGIEGYRFSDILDAYRLYAGLRREIANPFLRSFRSYHDLEAYGREVEDWEILSLCKVVSKYGDEIPYLVNRVRETAVEIEEADVILTTAHKAKGQEFRGIRVCKDFPAMFRQTEDSKFKTVLSSDEFNLLYVTVTRAMDRISFEDVGAWGEFVKDGNWPGYDRIMDYFGLKEKSAGDERPMPIETEAGPTLNKYRDIYLDDEGVMELESIISLAETDREQAAERIVSLRQRYPNSPQLCISMAIFTQAKFIEDKMPLYKSAVDLDPGFYNGYRWVSRGLRAGAFLLSRVSGPKRLELVVLHSSFLAAVENCDAPSEIAAALKEYEDLFAHDWEEIYDESLDILREGLANMDRSRYSSHELDAFAEEYELMRSLQRESRLYAIYLDYLIAIG